MIMRNFQKTESLIVIFLTVLALRVIVSLMVCFLTLPKVENTVSESRIVLDLSESGNASALAALSGHKLILVMHFHNFFTLDLGEDVFGH